MKRQNRRLLSRLDKFIEDFVISSNMRAREAEIRGEESQNNDFVSNCGQATRGENSRSHTQVTERNIADRIRKWVDSAVASDQIEFMTLI